MIQVDLPMPEACDVCPFNYDFCWCKAFKDDEFDQYSDDWNDHVCDRRCRPDYCPLKEQEVVVRCKDCKHFDKSLSYWATRGYCDMSSIRHGDDWFCADGERKKVK